MLLNSVGMMGEVVVLGWLSLELTNSPFLVGVAMSMRALPLFFDNHLLDHKLRRLEPGQRTDLKVLLTTGYAAETDSMIANIREPVLRKPYKKQQLAQALRNVLGKAA